ncbi:peptidylprolyl isomerase [Asticcacaulis solisilvae]|uniref:peptidylprolyl isomerase n=1 Tax=Asticcacaulis solisilvae TaxID=1217274 RepID=UPI003FD77781
MSGVKTKAAIAGALAALMMSTSAFAVDPGYREPDADHTLVIDTNKGRVIVEMYPQLAPAHVERLITLTRQHFYDGLIFHRVIEDFMDQTGDPKGTGEGGSTLPDLKAEFTIRKDASFPLAVVGRPAGAVTGFMGAMPVQSQVSEMSAITADGKTAAWGLYCQGVLGMAHSFDPNSGNSQFFLMRGTNATLEAHYTAFGVVISGGEVVRKIKIGEPPVNPDKMLKVQVLADMAPADRPKVQVMDTRSPQFQALVDQMKKSKGPDITPCDIKLPVKIAGVEDKPEAAPTPLITQGLASPTPPAGAGPE